MLLPALPENSATEETIEASKEEVEYHALQHFPHAFQSLAENPKFEDHDVSFPGQTLVPKRIHIGESKEGKGTRNVHAYMTAQTPPKLIISLTNRSGYDPKEPKWKSFKARLWWKCVLPTFEPAPRHVDLLKVMLRYYFLRHNLVPCMVLHPNTLARFEIACVCISQREWFCPEEIPIQYLTRKPQVPDEGLSRFSGHIGGKPAPKYGLNVMMLDQNHGMLDNMDTTTSLKRPHSALEITPVSVEASEDNESNYMTVLRNQRRKHTQEQYISPEEVQVLAGQNDELRRALENTTRNLREANAREQAAQLKAREQEVRASKADALAREWENQAHGANWLVPHAHGNFAQERTQQLHLETQIDSAKNQRHEIDNQVKEQKATIGTMTAASRGLSMRLDEEKKIRQNLEQQLSDSQIQQKNAEKFSKMYKEEKETVMQKAIELYKNHITAVREQLEIIGTPTYVRDSALKDVEDKFGEFKVKREG
ncbi:hypothetical protein BCR34DRAFT_589212 [Clohesyomyces aquaticus]|uniref:Uncharacterized protein n=1 Tax=Clohesyomyces aquaticus TaxID=1231657 RepID=A0A1Y1ZHC8_9PLEO|nr:hypothetical protein BCR34DRAFT_589212 [Clohesyomyces aquaticus]